MQTMTARLGGWVDSLLAWLFPERNLYEKRKQDKAEAKLMEKLKTCFFCLALIGWDLGMILLPLEGHTWVNVLGVLWPASAISWMVFRLLNEMEEEGHDLITEVLLLWKIGDLWARVFFWPLDAISYLSGGRSLKNELWSKLLHELMESCGGYCKDWMHDVANRDTNREMEETYRAAARIQELPQTIELNARTAYACGATVMTIASATAAPVPKTTSAEIRTFGWISVVETVNVNTEESETRLSNAHIGMTYEDKSLGLTGFAELELTQVGKNDANWLQMVYVGYKPVDTDEIRIGHIALAASWVEPPPFLLEPVSFQRIPFYFYGWGLQYSMNRDPWNLIIDVATDSSVRFDDMKQLDGAQASFFLRRTVSPKLTIGPVGEITAVSQTLGLFASVKHTPELYSRGTMYVGTRSGHELVGMFLTTVYTPSKRLGEQLDLHTVLDVQNTSDPLRYSVGARVQTESKRWSATVDFTHQPKSDTRLIEMRLQHRF